MSSPADAASVALIHKQKVLLIKRAYAPYQHLWTLPGGRIEPGETIEQCAAREIKEELGLSIGDIRPVLVQALGTDGKFMLAVFATEAFEGEIAPSDEIADHRWVNPADLEALSTTDRLDDVLAKAFALFERS